MREIAKTDRCKPMPPAAGQFGQMPPSDRSGQGGYHPAGCPSLDQFEARFLFSSEGGSPPKSA